MRTSPPQPILPVPQVPATGSDPWLLSREPLGRNRPGLAQLGYGVPASRPASPSPTHLLRSSPRVSRPRCSSWGGMLGEWGLSVLLCRRRAPGAIWCCPLICPLVMLMSMTMGGRRRDGSSLSQQHTYISQGVVLSDDVSPLAARYPGQPLTGDSSLGDQRPPGPPQGQEIIMSFRVKHPNS